MANNYDKNRVSFQPAEVSKDVIEIAKIVDEIFNQYAESKLNLKEEQSRDPEDLDYVLFTTAYSAVLSLLYYRLQHSEAK